MDFKELPVISAGSSTIVGNIQENPHHDETTSMHFFAILRHFRMEET